MLVHLLAAALIAESLIPSNIQIVDSVGNSFTSSRHTLAMSSDSQPVDDKTNAESAELPGRTDLMPYLYKDADDLFLLLENENWDIEDQFENSTEYFLNDYSLTWNVYSENENDIVTYITVNQNDNYSIDGVYAGMPCDQAIELLSSQGWIESYVYDDWNTDFLNEYSMERNGAILTLSPYYPFFPDDPVEEITVSLNIYDYGTTYYTLRNKYSLISATGYSWDSIVLCSTEDFSKDGTCESFMVVNPSLDESGFTYPGELWFVSNDDPVKLEESSAYVYSAADRPWDYDLIGKAFYVDVMDDASSFYRTHIWTVKNGKAEPSVLSNEGDIIGWDSNGDIEFITFSENGEVDTNYYFFYDNKSCDFLEYGSLEIDVNAVKDLIPDDIIGEIEAGGGTIESVYYKDNGIIIINFLLDESHQRIKYDLNNHFMSYLVLDDNSVYYDEGYVYGKTTHDWQTAATSTTSPVDFNSETAVIPEKTDSKYSISKNSWQTRTERTYSYDGELLSITEDHKDIQYSNTYIVNEFGDLYLSSESFYNENGYTTESIQYNYDGSISNRRVEHDTSLGEEPGYDMYYGNSTNPTVVNYNSPDYRGYSYNSSSNVNREYDENGNIIKSTSFNQNGEIISEITREYNELGNIIYDDYRNEDGAIEYYTIYTYDEEDNPESDDDESIASESNSSLDNQTQLDSDIAEKELIKSTADYSVYRYDASTQIADDTTFEIFGDYVIFENPSDAAQKLSEVVFNKCRSFVEGTAQNANVFLNQSGPGNYIATSEITSVYADQKIVSICSRIKEYYGGMFLDGYDAHTYSQTSGAELSLQEYLSVSEDELKSIVLDVLLAYSESSDIPEIDDFTIDSFITNRDLNENPYMFYINDFGTMLLVDAREVWPAYVGARVIPLN